MNELERLKAKRAHELVLLFNSPSRDDRAAAQQELAGMGQTAVPALVNALSLDDEFMRLEATRVLAQIGEPSAVDGLVADLERHPNERGDRPAFAMQAIARGCSAFRRNDMALVNFLHDMCQSDDDFVVAYAVEAMGKVGNSRSGPVLKRLRQHRSPQVKAKIRDALRALEEGPKSMERPWTDDEIRVGLESSDANTRNLAVKALSERENEDATPPVGLLDEIMRHGGPIGRRSALQLFPLWSPRRAISYGLDIAEDEQNPELLAQAMRSMSQTTATLSEDDADRLCQVLPRLLAHNSLQVQAAAAAAIARLPSNVGARFIVQALSNEEALVRAEVVRLAATVPPEHLKPYFGQLTAATIDVANRAVREGNRDYAESVGTLLDRQTEWIDHASGDQLDAMQRAAFVALRLPLAAARKAGLRHLAEQAEHGSLRGASRAEGDDVAAALGASNQNVLLDALTVLHAIARPEHRFLADKLVPVLYKGDKRMALRAIDVLKRLDPRDTHAILQALSTNPDRDVAEAARTALPG